MAASLTVRTDLVMRRLALILTDETFEGFPAEQFAKWGWPLAEQNKPLMLTKQALAVLGEAAVDRVEPELGEHRMYFKGRELADPHYDRYPDLIDGALTARRHKYLVKVLGNFHLERALRNDGS